MFSNRTEEKCEKILSSKAFEVLNSNFVLAVIGGVVATVLTFALSSCEASRVRELTRAKQRYDYKVKLLHTYANDYPLWLDAYFGLKSCEIEQLEYEKQLSSIGEREGESVKTIIAKKEASQEDEFQYSKMLLGIRSVESYCYEIDLVYKNPGIKKSIILFNSKIREIDKLPCNQRQLFTTWKEVKDTLSKICGMMSAEVLE